MNLGDEWTLLREEGNGYLVTFASPAPWAQVSNRMSRLWLCLWDVIFLKNRTFFVCSKTLFLCVPNPRTGVAKPVRCPVCGVLILQTQMTCVLDQRPCSPFGLLPNSLRNLYQHFTSFPNNALCCMCVLFRPVFTSGSFDCLKKSKTPVEHLAGRTWRGISAVWDITEGW